MKDIAMNNGDFLIQNTDSLIIEDSEALVQQLYVFLNIRACHKNGSGKIIVPGELEFDQDQGIDYTFIFETTTTEAQIRNHFKSKILKYYKDYIKNISKMDVIKNSLTRTITIDFEYKTIWSNERQTFQIEV